MRAGRATGEGWLRLGDAAAELGVSLNTLRRWSDAGKLTCYRSPGGHRRYRRVDLEAFLLTEGQKPVRISPEGLDDFDASLHTLARVAADGTGVDRCRITLIRDHDAAEISASVDVAARDRLPQSPSPGDVTPAARAVLRSGCRLVVGDLDATALLQRNETEAHRVRGDVAVLAVPVTVSGHTRGVLELVDTRQSAEFDGSKVAFAEFAARQVARLIDSDAADRGRRDIFEKPARAEELPAAISPPSQCDAGIVAARRPRFEQPCRVSDVEVLVLATLGALRARAEPAACTLYLIEDGVASFYPPGDENADPIAEGRSWCPDDFPSVARALADRSMAVVSAHDEPEEGLLAGRDLWGVVVVPLVSGDRVAGVLELGAIDPGGLAALQEIALVAADLLAVTLDANGGLANLRRRNRDLALVVEAGLEDVARLSIDDVLHALVEQLSRLTHTPVADIFALEGDALRALVSYDNGDYEPEWDGVIVPLSRYPCSRRAVETGDIVVASSLDDPVLDADGRASLERWGYQAHLSMPLVARGRILGLVELSDYQPRDYTDELDLIRGLGQVAAHALETAALSDQVERRDRILNALIELGALASDARDLEGLVRTVAERVVATVDAANCDLYRMQDGELRCVASYDRSGHDTSVLGSRFDLDLYPTTVEAIYNHQILTISSPDDPQLSEAEQSAYHDYGFASEVCLPLIEKDELLGLLDVYDTRERDYAEFLGFLRGAAQAVSAAFANARLADRLAQRGAVLRDIAELGVVNEQAHDLEAVLTTLAERLRDTIAAADCDIYALQDDKLRCLVSADRHGLDLAVVGHVLDIERFPATALAVQTGQPMTITTPDDPRLTDQERSSLAEYGFQSELCIPLIAGDRVIGLIDVFDTRPRDYDEHLDFLRIVGQTAAGAIENAVLLDKLERRNTALAELAELGRTASSAGSLDQLVRAIGPRVVELMEADGCQVFILRGDTLHCVLTYDDGQFLDDFADRSLDLDLFPSTRSAITKRSALVIESPDDPRLSEYERSLYLESGTQSEICVPLVLEHRVVGLLDVYDHRRRDYAEHQDFLLRVGQMMAGAFENALLMEQLEDSNQTLGLLVESGMEFGATLDRDQVLESVARRLCAATSAPNCDIFTLHGDVIRCAACIDHGAPDPGYVGTEYSLGQLGLTRLALESRQPLSAEDIASDSRVSEFERREDLGWGHRSKLSLPLISRGQVIGVAGIYDDHVRRFERPDFLHSLAQVAAGAMANASLFDELDRSAERMALVSDVSFELSSSLELHDVLLSTARRLCAVAVAPMCDIYTLHDGETLESVTSIDEDMVDSAWEGRRFPLAAWHAVHRAVESREPVVVSGRDDPLLSAEEVALMDEHAEAGTLIVPLISRERVIGVLQLTHREPHVYSTEETATIVSICRFAALAIDNAELYEGIKGMHLSNLKALSSALNAKDYYTLGHAARVAGYMVLLGEELGWPDALLREVEEAAYLHDIGKIGVPDRVLLKPSGLNEHEWELMRQHPIFSAEIIRPLFDEALVAGVRHHHERWDGDGYPDGLASEDIPLVARAMCVADSYDAMSFRRPYRQGLTAEECLGELERCSGDQFDPGMVSTFRRVLEQIAEGRQTAAGIAARAAAALTADECVLLRERRDDSSSAFAAVTQTLRETREASGVARYVTLLGRDSRQTIVLAHSAAGTPGSPRLGEEVVTDDELLEVFAGRAVSANVLFVDQWGVWISGVAPVLADDGSVAAVVSADIPATRGVAEVEGLPSNVAQTLASMLHTSAAQSGRAELEAITDSLTGLYNHRYFHERLSHEVDRCREEGTSIALLFCDLDNFRSFNEQHGHGSGDTALRAVARVIESSVRHVDLTARYGGEEFAAILIDTDEDGALEVAERIRSGLTRTMVADAHALSVSIGVATCPGDAEFKDELVDKADWAMYLAKRRGRDKVMTFAAGHGRDAPGQATAVRPGHIVAMGELVAAQEAFRQRRRSAVSQIALGVARLVDVPSAEVRAAVVALEAGDGETETQAGRIVFLADAYQAFVTGRPYRERVSEVEALDELVRCPALAGEEDLAHAFQQVLAR